MLTIDFNDHEKKHIMRAMGLKKCELKNEITDRISLRRLFAILMRTKVALKKEN